MSTQSVCGWLVPEIEEDSKFESFKAFVGWKRQRHEQSQWLNIGNMQINSPDSQGRFSFDVKQQSSSNRFLCKAINRKGSRICQLKDECVLPLEFAVYGKNDKHVRANILYS